MFRKTFATLATAALGVALATSSAHAFPMEGGGYRHAVPNHGQHGRHIRHHRGGGFGGGLATGLAVGIGMALIGEAIRQSQQQERVDPYRDGPTRERPRTTERPAQPAKQPNVPQGIRAPEPDISYGTTAYPKMPPMVQVDDTPRRVHRKKDCSYLEKKVAKLEFEISRILARMEGRLIDKRGREVGTFDTAGWDAAGPKADLADRQEQLRRTKAELDACRRAAA